MQKGRKKTHDMQQTQQERGSTYFSWEVEEVGPTHYLHSPFERGRQVDAGPLDSKSREHSAVRTQPHDDAKILRMRTDAKKAHNIFMSELGQQCHLFGKSLSNLRTKRRC